MERDYSRTLSSAQKRIERLEEENKKLKFESAETRHQKKMATIQEKAVGGSSIQQILEENQVLKAQLTALKARLQEKKNSL